MDFTLDLLNIIAWPIAAIVVAYFLYLAVESFAYRNKLR